MESQARTLSGINILAGIWLIISPFMLNYSSSGNKWQQFVFGVIVTVLGIVRWAAPHMSWASWINMFIGIWLIIAPWAIPSSVAARWTEVVTGIIVALLAYSNSAITTNMHHHGQLHA